MPLHPQMRLNERGSGEATPAEPSGAVARVPAFRTVYRDYFDFVWSTVRRLGASAEAVDDLVQEIFIVIYAKLDTLERTEALRSWIYGITRRTVSTHRRAKRASAPHATPLAEVISLDPTPLEQTEQHAALELLAKLLGELDEPKREVFALVELEELSVPEVAEMLELPLNTAYSRLRAARQAFEAALARHEARSKGR